MPIWKEAGNWRFQFQLLGKRFSRQGFKTKAMARSEMEKLRAQLIAAEEQPTPTVMAFSEVANDYLDYAKRRFVLKVYDKKVYVFREFLKHAGDLTLNRITVRAVESYLATRPTNTNYNRHRKELSALFNWAFKRQLMGQNPCLFIPTLPEPEFRKMIPTEEDMARILLAAAPDRPFLMVLYLTMARVDEIFRLRWDDINFQEKTIRLWTRKVKDGSWRGDVLPMSQLLYDVLKGLWDKRTHPEWVFVNPRTGSRYTQRSRLMKKICRQAGVKYFGFHAIRHFGASLLADREKVSLPTISRLLRHTNLRTTEKYLQKVDPNLRETMERLGEQDLLADLLAGSGGRELEGVKCLK
jgi:integrase